HQLDQSEAVLELPHEELPRRNSSYILSIRTRAVLLTYRKSMTCAGSTRRARVGPRDRGPEGRQSSDGDDLDPADVRAGDRTSPSIDSTRSESVRRPKPSGCGCCYRRRKLPPWRV